MDGSAGAKPSEISVGEGDTNKMFLLPEFVERILGYLDEKDLLQARGVNKAVWKPEAENWLLQMRFQKKLESASTFITYPTPTSDGGKGWLSEYVKTGTWFKSTLQIKEFLEDMESYEGNPFPNRTLVICLPFENGNHDLAQADFGDFNSELTKLITKFGEEIWNFFVAPPFGRLLGEYTLCILKNLLTLSNIELFCLFLVRYDGIDREEVAQLEEFARDRASLEKLKTLYIYDISSDLCFKNLFWRTGNANQLEELHMSAENFENLCIGKLPVRRLSLDGFPRKFQQFHTNFIGDCIFYQLEELRLTFDWEASWFEIETICAILKVSDWAGFNKLKKLSICVYPSVFFNYHYSLVERFENRFPLGAGHGVEKFAHDQFNFPAIVDIQNLVKYPALKELTIDYSIIEALPQLLTLFSVKFPKWEVLHLEDMNKGIFKHFYPSIAQLFEDICQELWRYVPDTVHLITGEKTTLKSSRPGRPQLVGSE